MDTYGIFKIFILNPRKDPKVVKALFKKKDKLLEILKKEIKPTAENQVEQVKFHLLSKFHP